jgi:hypothetical protein
MEKGREGYWDHGFKICNNPIPPHPLPTPEWLTHLIDTESRTDSLSESLLELLLPSLCPLDPPTLSCPVPEFFSVVEGFVERLLARLSLCLGDRCRSFLLNSSRGRLSPSLERWSDLLT